MIHMPRAVRRRRSGRMSRSSGFAAACISLLVLVAGCASDQGAMPPGNVQPDRFLFDRGTEALNDEDWLEAREYFRQLVDGYPQSPFRADAKLGIGDAFLGQGTTEARTQAIGEFREFLTFYPTHQRADYAQYKLAMAYYYQMRGPERDQTPTKEAIREFEVFVERYPNSQLLEEVRARLRESRDRLSESEYRVGLFYFRAGWLPGAIDRFNALLDQDPEYTRRDAVYYHLAESLMRSGKPAEALPYYERLIKEFERSEYLEQAWRRVGELKTDS